MVSFQCNACGDVCTKPKLDKHRGQCQSSFDCIDCGKRFNTPADYKGHTTCISEAEKYEKSVYKSGKQNGNGGRNYNQRSWSSHGRQHGEDRSAWGRSVSRATGANDTPLGTPIRMSPITDTPSLSKTTTTAAPNGQETAAPAEPHATEPNAKKRKFPDVTDQVTVEADVEHQKKKRPKTIASDSTIPSQRPKEKKSKGDEKEKKATDLLSIPVPPSSESPTGEDAVVLETEGKKKKRDKKKKSKGNVESAKEVVTIDSQPLGEAAISSDPRPKKRRGEEALEGTATIEQDTEVKKKVKSSSKKKKVANGVDEKGLNLPNLDEPSNTLENKEESEKTAKTSKKKRNRKSIAVVGE